MPTYKGYRFRSMLERRWARFLDGLGLRWCYEPHSFGGYLPDFYLFGAAGCYVEVRGVLAVAELKQHTARIDACVPAERVVALVGGHWYLRVLDGGALVAGAIRVLGAWRTAVWVARESGGLPHALAPYPACTVAFPDGQHESAYTVHVDERGAERRWASAHRATQWMPRAKG